jgi:hypothetical protein
MIIMDESDILAVDSISANREGQAPAVAYGNQLRQFESLHRS